MKTAYTTETVLKFPGRKSATKRENAPAFPCGCKPYRDILTAGRWHFLGHYIRKGESAMHRAGRFATTPLFCRCQLADTDTALVYTGPENIDEIPGFDR